MAGNFHWAASCLLVAAFWLGLQGLAQAAPDWELVELRRQLSALSDELRDEGPRRDETVPALIHNIAWAGPRQTDIPTEEFVEPKQPAQFGWGDLRIALMPMRQIYGGRNDKQVLLARKNNFEALEIKSGTATLAQLLEILTNRHLGFDVAHNAHTLRVPIVVAPGATLRLGPNDVLQLSRSDGAFIINFGRLEFFGAKVAATNAANKYSDSFRPFIANVGSGSAHLSGARLSNLGFGGTAKFSGFSVLAYPTMQPSQRTVVENTQFDQLVTLSLVGAAAAELTANRFYSMQRNSILVSRSAQVRLISNLFAGNSPTNAVRISNGSDGAKLIGNIILEGSRAGLLVASGSDHVEIRDNLIWRRNGGGVKVNDTSCARIEANLILDDKQKGVEVRNSHSALVHRNEIIGNRNAGVWVSAQTPTEVTYVTENRLRENGSGLSTASGGEIVLSRNDLSNQFPRFLDGDITHQYRTVIDDLMGANAIYLSAANTRPANQLWPRECEQR